VGAGGGADDMLPEMGDGARDGVVEDGRVHPEPVPVEDGGNFVSLVLTSREWEVAGGVGDLTESFIGESPNQPGTRIICNIPVVLAIFEDADDEGI